MTSHALRVFQRAMTAWNAGDTDGVIANYAPDAELDLRGLALPDEEFRHGHADMRELFAQLAELWREFRFEGHEIEERHGWVVVSGTMRATAESSGLEVEREFSEAILVSDGRIVRDIYFGKREGAAGWVTKHGRPLLVAAPNLSEGRDLAKLERLERSVGPARILDVHSDPDHNRSVFTLAARQGELAAGLVSLARGGGARDRPERAPRRPSARGRARRDARGLAPRGRARPGLRRGAHRRRSRRRRSRSCRSSSTASWPRAPSTPSAPGSGAAARPRWPSAWRPGS